MSSPLQIELRISRALRIALLAIAALALLALLASDAPRAMLPVVPLLLALAWPRRLPGVHRRLVFRADGSVVGVGATDDETPLRIGNLQQRGPLCVLTLFDAGQGLRYLFTPETLSAAQRRLLQLWFDRHRPSRGGIGIATHV